MPLSTDCRFQGFNENLKTVGNSAVEVQNYRFALSVMHGLIISERLFSASNPNHELAFNR